MPEMRISVVIPVYNEEANLKALMGRLLPVMESLARPFEIILVDDGSRDASLVLLREFTAHPSVRVVELTRNYGQHAAVMAGLAQARGDIVVTLDADLDGLEIFADLLLERVFFNLVENGIRHGGDVTRIRLWYVETGGEVVLTYQDDGVGIPMAQKEQIFERGYGSNTGLGLFLIREILSITGLSIRETGVPGEGARFEILVPKGAVRRVLPVPDPLSGITHD